MKANGKDARAVGRIRGNLFGKRAFYERKGRKKYYPLI
jgi:hypothetical protein